MGVYWIIIVFALIVDDGTKQPFVNEDLKFFWGIIYSAQRPHF